MIKAVFFDFYNTVVYFRPPLDEIQQASCMEVGLGVSKSGVRKGYAMADEFMGQENSVKPLAERDQEEQGKFFTEYERIILKGAGLDVSPRLAQQVWSIASQVPKDFALFDDVIPAMQLLKKQGIILGVISNLREDMVDISKGLGLEPYLDFTVTAAEAGAEKPHPPIFLAALERAGVSPREAMHVGDQYQSDVEGARAIGISPVLLDREGWYPHLNDCSRIATLPELDKLVAEGR